MVWQVYFLNGRVWLKVNYGFKIQHHIIWYSWYRSEPPALTPLTKCWGIAQSFVRFYVQLHSSYKKLCSNLEWNAVGIIAHVEFHGILPCKDTILGHDGVQHYGVYVA